MIEEWRKIKINKNGIDYDFSDAYEVSNLGNVRSIDRYVVSSNGRKRFLKGKMRTPILDKYGYLLVSLWKDGKGGLFKIHRLVCTMFLPNPNNLPIINHRDENPANNVLDNLEWCDNKYNTNYGNAIDKRTESWKAQWSKEQSKRMIETRRKNDCVGSPKYVLQICPITNAIINIFSSTMEAERLTNIQHIYRVANGSRKTAGGYKWIYLDNYLADWWDIEMNKIKS